MTKIDAESMHRLAKMALDAGDAASPEEALEIFSRYRLRIHLGAGWGDTRAGQACFLTVLNTAVRAFLGGVEVYGVLETVLDVPLYEGIDVSVAIASLGGEVAEGSETKLPTIVIGEVPSISPPEFFVRLSWDHWCCSLVPAYGGGELVCRNDNPLAGVAAAALGVNEAFLYVRDDIPDAGHRSIGFSLWNPIAVADWSNPVNKGPTLTYLPKALWLVGLGHLGQAYAWTIGMLPYQIRCRPHLVLQDFDRAAESNISTCLMLSRTELEQRKVRIVAKRLEAVGFTTAIVERRFGANHKLMADEPTTALFGVDNVNARRDIESAGFDKVVEGGLGSGYKDFRGIRIHSFPGSRKPSDIWGADTVAQSSTELNHTYKTLVDKYDDLCGVTLLASRAVATPFVGVMAAAMVLSEVIRPLHGGAVYATLDLQMKNIRYCTGSAPSSPDSLSTPFVQVGTC